MKLRTILIALLLSVQTAKVGADTISFSSSFAPQQFSLGTQSGGSVGSNSASTLNWNAGLGANFEFPQFDPLLGTLTSIEIDFQATISAIADVLFANNQLPPLNQAGINFNLTTTVSLGDVNSIVSSSNSTNLNGTVTATTSSTPFTINVGSGSILGPSTIVPSTEFATYLGTGNIVLPMNINFAAEATTSNGAFIVTPFPTIGVDSARITYGFTSAAVPEPSSFGLIFALGLVSVWRFYTQRPAHNIIS